MPRSSRSADWNSLTKIAMVVWSELTRSVPFWMPERLTTSRTCFVTSRNC
jgi:hypothetical protein